MPKLIDMTNQKFGRLTVMEVAPRPDTAKTTHHKHWLCRCTCGREKVVDGSSLRKGLTKSCGCLAREGTSNLKHGKSKTRLYGILADMRQRCTNPNNKSYKYYGGRGIKVCDEWLDKDKGFTSFYNWAMANGYSDDLTIDRINPNGDYSESNCRWATASEQNFNKGIRCDNSTGHTGVYIMPNGKCRACISRDGKIKHIGLYNTLEEAVEARERAERELYPDILKGEEQNNVSHNKENT